MRVLILHGWGGSDFPHWQSWLAGELAKEYGCVQFLRFSDVDAPKLSIWLEELRAALDSFKPDVVICHSLANTLWFHLCNNFTLKRVQKLYLVAPPSMCCDVHELREFFPVERPLDLYASEVLLISSTDDPYMTQEEACKLQNELGIEMKVLQNAGHINSSSGFGPWPWIYEELHRESR